MTATDMQSMHRMGAPDVSPDGRTAVFTLSDTDWTKNKRVNRLYQLDLTAKGAMPVPIAGADKGHDAMFAGDGSLWFLMPVGEHDQLFRKARGAKAGRRSAPSPATSAGSGCRRRATTSSSGPTATCAAPTSIAPVCRPSRRPAAAAPTT